MVPDAQHQGIRDGLEEQGQQQQATLPQQRAQTASPLLRDSAADVTADAGAGESSGGTAGDPPASKRRRPDNNVPRPQQPQQPAHMTALPAGGGALAVDPSLVGSAITGTVEAVSDSAYFVSLFLGDHEFKGTLVCPPPGFLSLPGGSVAAAAGPPPPAPVKRPRTAYNFFSDAVRPGAKARHPNADQKGISKVVGDMWNQLAADERAPYLEEARRDRERYDRELKEFQARHPQGSRPDLQRKQRASVAQQAEQQPGPAWQHAPRQEGSFLAAAPAGPAAGEQPPKSSSGPGRAGLVQGSRWEAYSMLAAATGPAPALPAPWPPLQQQPPQPQQQQQQQQQQARSFAPFRPGLQSRASQPDPSSSGEAGTASLQALLLHYAQKRQSEQQQQQPAPQQPAQQPQPAPQWPAQQQEQEQWLQLLQLQQAQQAQQQRATSAATAEPDSSNLVHHLLTALLAQGNQGAPAALRTAVASEMPRQAAAPHHGAPPQPVPLQEQQWQQQQQQWAQLWSANRSPGPSQPGP